MPLFRSESIILRSYSLSEADKIVVLFTRDRGIVRGVAKGAKRLKSRFGSSLEPFSVANVEYFEKEHSELATIRSAEIERSHFLEAAVPDHLAVFSNIAELLIAFSPPHDPNEMLYRMLKACLASGADSPGSLAAVSVYFKLWLLRLGGYLPDWSKCHACGREFAANEPANLTGGWHLICTTCSRPGARLRVEPKVRETFFSIQKLPPAEFAAAKRPDAGSLAELSAILERLVTSVLGIERAPAYSYEKS